MLYWKHFITFGAILFLLFIIQFVDSSKVSFSWFKIFRKYSNICEYFYNQNSITESIFPVRMFWHKTVQFTSIKYVVQTVNYTIPDVIFARRHARTVSQYIHHIQTNVYEKKNQTRLQITQTLMKNIMLSMMFPPTLNQTWIKMFPTMMKNNVNQKSMISWRKLFSIKVSKYF